MSDILCIPDVIIHQINNGGTLTGVTPNGTDNGESLLRGRYRLYTNCTNGGLIEMDSSLKDGFRIERVSFNLTGVTAVNLYVRSPQGIDFLVGDYTGAAGYYEWRQGGTLVPPGFTFKAVATGTLSAAGGIMFVLSQGWKESAYQSNNVLGREVSPPSQFEQ